MKRKKCMLLLTVIIIFSMLIVTSKQSLAQGLTSPCNGGDPDVDCPIDGSLLALTAAVLVYGWIKINSSKQQTS